MRSASCCCSRRIASELAFCSLAHVTCCNACSYHAASRAAVALSARDALKHAALFTVAAHPTICVILAITTLDRSWIKSLNYSLDQALLRMFISSFAATAVCICCTFVQAVVLVVGHANWLLLLQLSHCYAAGIMQPRAWDMLQRMQFSRRTLGSCRLVSSVKLDCPLDQALLWMFISSWTCPAVQNCTAQQLQHFFRLNAALQMRRIAD